jgi:carboxyl-terminal processing protease
VQILRFTGRTPDELQAALDGLNTDKVQALVLDLRNNSGGLLQESIDVASQFLDGGEVVVYEVTRDNEKVYQASSGGSAEKLPLVVLVNQGTASASELVAGAIQDDDRGILIGQATYGKGTVQQIFRLSDDSSVHITSAEWLTPKRQKIENLGLQPDVPMIPDANGRDVELGEALRQLQQQISQEDAA